MLLRKCLSAITVASLWGVASVIWGLFARGYRNESSFEFRIFMGVAILWSILAVILFSVGFYYLHLWHKFHNDN